MPTFKKYKLGDVAELVKDTYHPSAMEHLDYIGLEHIEQQSLRLSGIGNSSDVTSNKFKFESGDILFGKLRPYFRKVYRPKFSGVCSTDIWVVRAKKGFNQEFLFYFMANGDFIDLSMQGSGGTRMPRADWNNLKNTEWELPDLPTQTRIASILSALDDKIELNRQMNQTLEQMAQALFKKYFVDDIDPDNLPEGWSVKGLDDIVEFQNGFAFYTIGYSSSGYRVVDLANIHEEGKFIETKSDKFIDASVYNAPKFSKYHLMLNDIVMAMTDMTQKMGILGKCGIIKTDNRYILNQRIGRLRVKKGIHPYFLLTYLNSKSILEELKTKSLGSVQKYINTSHIKDLSFLIPTEVIMNEFTTHVVPLIDKVHQNDAESRRLASIRDILLPKLMSGEIEVNAEVENEVFS